MILVATITVDIISGVYCISNPDKPNSLLQWTPLIVTTLGPALSGHNNRWLLYPVL